MLLGDCHRTDKSQPSEVRTCLEGMRPCKYLLRSSIIRSNKANLAEEPLHYRTVEDPRILQPFPVSFFRALQE